ncbi:MAG: TetR/AcrR family transcriptional regulator [Reyranella sp.]|jgi:AcrR family transcriptional regulator|nr:TetR/AcrR family transcriptional regulator [Reyranella sp.]
MDGQALQSKQNLPAGRVDRVARTREAIVASALALAAAGQVAPIVRDIAQMAGVSARTVFQHFADTAELYVAVLGRVLASLVGEAPELVASSPVEERIARLVDKCADRYEQLRPMWTFVETLQRRSTEAADMISRVYSANSANLAQAFAPELGGLPPESRRRALTALALAIAPESWVVLRQRLGLSVDQAREELGFVVKSVFATAVARR